MKEIPEWIKGEDEAEMGGPWTDANNFIMANLASGRTIDEVCLAIIHPATGLSPTPEQLKYSFPTAFVDEIANMNAAASLYTLAVSGGRGDRIKAATTWLSTRDGDRWKDQAKRVEITGKDGEPIDTKVSVDLAMLTVNSLLESIADKKKERMIEAVKVDELKINIPNLDLPDITYTNNKKK